MLLRSATLLQFTSYTEKVSEAHRRGELSGRRGALACSSEVLGRRYSAWRGLEGLPVRSLPFLYLVGRHRVSSDLAALEGSCRLQLCSQGAVSYSGQEAGNVESASSF